MPTAGTEGAVELALDGGAMLLLGALLTTATGAADGALLLPPLGLLGDADTAATGVSVGSSAMIEGGIAG